VRSSQIQPVPARASQSQPDGRRAAGWAGGWLGRRACSCLKASAGRRLHWLMSARLLRAAARRSGTWLRESRVGRTFDFGSSSAAVGGWGEEGDRSRWPRGGRQQPSAVRRLAGVVSRFSFDRSIYGSRRRDVTVRDGGVEPYRLRLIMIMIRALDWLRFTYVFEKRSA
jgi:hypothetical protein